MKNNIEVYRCELCGNIITKLYDSGMKVVCCGKDMGLLEANVVDAAVEKHVPAFLEEDGKVKVQIGSVAHPMTPEHYIQFILATDGELSVYKKLDSSDKPEMIIDTTKINKAFEYCNLHGFWKADK